MNTYQHFRTAEIHFPSNVEKPTQELGIFRSRILHPGQPMRKFYDFLFFGGAARLSDPTETYQQIQFSGLKAIFVGKLP